MAEKKQFHILIVDDEPGVCAVLIDVFKSRGYRAGWAANGEEALRQMEADLPDMVISDIHMPVIDGFELIRTIDRKYPLVKNVLMTGYDIDQYISLVRRHNIGNILVKGPDFNIQEVLQYVESLLNADIFGLERYFPGVPLARELVTSYPDAKKICTRISRQCPKTTELFLEIAVDELISNAVFHGVLQLTGIPREHWREDYTIPRENGITITWGHDSDKIGVAVEDPKGNLKKIDVLHWLDHDGLTRRGEMEHGRGFLLVRRLIDRFIINIDPGKRTECIVIQYFDRNRPSSLKPLLIHEL